MSDAYAPGRWHRLGAETLDARIEVTYGSIAEAQTHLMDADDRYLQRMRDPRPPHNVAHGTQSPVELRERVLRNDERWTELLDELDQGTLDVWIEDRDDLPDPRHTEGLLLQAHGNDHRTHVCSTLGVLGLDVPDLDGWSSWPARSA